MASIAYQNKDKNGSSPASQWRDVDANEVKSVVNLKQDSNVNLTAIAETSGTGLLRRTGPATWELYSNIFDLTTNAYDGSKGTKSGINTITGLKAIPTVGLSLNIYVQFRDTGNGNVLRVYELVSGTDAESSPGTIRPDDYFATSNEKVWKLTNVVVSVNGQTGVVTLTKSDIGLDEVDNTSDADKPVSTAQQTAIDQAESDANNYTDDAIAQEVTDRNAAITAAVTGLWDDRGNYDASGDAFPASGGSGTAGAILKGDIWTISVAGTLGGSVVAIGDTVRALVDTPGQTASNWAIAENNIGYVPENVANKSTDGTFASPSDTTYPTTQAVKTFGDTKETKLNVKTETGTSYTVVSGDDNYIIFFTNSSEVTVTLPALTGVKVTFAKAGTGDIVIVGSGTTIEATGTTISEQYTAATFTYKGSNVWAGFGALGVVTPAPSTVTTSGTLTINSVSGSLLTLDCNNRNESKFHFDANTSPLSVRLSNMAVGAISILTIERSSLANMLIRFEDKVYLKSSPSPQLINNGQDDLIVRGRSSGRTTATLIFYKESETGAQNNASSPVTTNEVICLSLMEDSGL